MPGLAGPRSVLRAWLLSFQSVAALGWCSGGGGRPRGAQRRALGMPGWGEWLGTFSAAMQGRARGPGLRERPCIGVALRSVCWAWCSERLLSLQQENAIQTMELRSYFSLYCLHQEMQLVHVYLPLTSHILGAFVNSQIQGHKEVGLPAPAPRSASTFLSGSPGLLQLALQNCRGRVVSWGSTGP